MEGTVYETFAMLKPTAKFSLDELERIVRSVAESGGAEVSRSGRKLRMSIGEAVLEIGENSDYYVAEECNEIADQLSIPRENFPTRYEFAAEDPELELFNDYLLVAERLQKTGKFVIFDCTQGKLLFEESEKGAL